MDTLGFFSFITKVLIYASTLVVLTATVLPLFKLNFWWVRAGAFPRLQIASLGLIALVLLIVFSNPMLNHHWFMVVSLLACVGYQLYWIMPYMPLYPRQVERSQQTHPQRTIRLMIANIFIDNKNPKPLLKLIDRINPDVILFAEINQRWMNNLQILDQRYPHSVKEPLDNAYGMALFSRLELINPQVHYLVEDDIPSIHTGVRLDSGDTINLYGIHPRPPFPTEAMLSTERDAELTLVGRMVKNHQNPTIIAGDLNDVAWSHTTRLFQKISGLLDPRIGRGMFSSFHADYPWMRFPLDHVFHSAHFRLLDIQRLPYVGSDHFPLLVELTIENGAKHSQATPDATEQEQQQASDMVTEAEQAEGNKL